MTKDIKRLMARLLAQDFTYQLSKSGRILVYQDGRQVASIPTTAQGQKMKDYVNRLEKVGFK